MVCVKLIDSAGTVHSAQIALADLHFTFFHHHRRRFADKCFAPHTTILCTSPLRRTVHSSIKSHPQSFRPLLWGSAFILSASWALRPTVHLDTEVQLPRSQDSQFVIFSPQYPVYLIIAFVTSRPRYVYRFSNFAPSARKECHNTPSYVSCQVTAAIGHHQKLSDRVLSASLLTRHTGVPGDNVADGWKHHEAPACPRMTKKRGEYPH